MQELERVFAVLLLVGLDLTTTGTAAAVDLGRIYRATLEPEKRPRGHDWVATTEDVWAIRQFGLVYLDDLRIRSGAANVIFGRDGTDVLWAVVLPEEPGEIVLAPGGKGEKFTSIFLRFHPALVRELFPPNVVLENGPPGALIQARRIYQYKIGDSWQHEGMPVVPNRSSIVVDCETTKGNRRFYRIDTRKRSVREEIEFLEKPIPPKDYGNLEEAAPVEVYDQTWLAFDRDYPLFLVKPDLDWVELRELYHPLAQEARGRYETAAIIALLLSHLEDPGVTVKLEDETVWCYEKYRFLNANYSGVQALTGKLVDSGNAVRWGKTRRNIGYLVVMNLLHRKIPETFDRVLQELEKTRGLVLDLRFNRGGDEEMARALAGRFLEKPVVYIASQHRNGPEHDDLGKRQERVVEPRGPWTYGKPVAVLCGERTTGAAESLVCMMAEVPGAVILGDRTAGSSCSPRTLELPGKIRVTLPGRLDRAPDGRPIHPEGVRPDVAIDVPPIKYGSTDDPVTRAALRLLEK